MAFRPFQERQLSLSGLQDEMNRLIERVWHSGVSTGPFDGQEWAPVIDLYEHPDHYTLFAEIPGVDGNSVELSYIEQSLTIRGEKIKPASIGDQDHPVRGERRFGEFCRTIELPRDIDADRLSARCHTGVLEVTIPKSEASRPKSIKIDVADD
jgi:HSP20 family protein